MSFRSNLLGALIVLCCLASASFAPPMPDFSCWQTPPFYIDINFARQCHGDANGQKVGMSWVGNDDASILQAVSNGVDWPAYYPESTNYNPRADFDRNFIVNDDDGDILSAYFGKSDIRIPMNCGQKLQLRPVPGPLAAGSIYTIEWDWTVYTGYVPLPGSEDHPTGPFELSYTTDYEGGTTVIDVVSNTTSYAWTVPNVNSANCKLYIEDLSHPGMIDQLGNTFTILPWAGPVIAFEPNELYFTGSADQSLIVWNSGGDVLDWQITEDCDWVEVIPSSGTSAGEPSEVIIRVDISSLESGNEYQCLLTISDPNAINNLQFIPVHLNLMECVEDTASFYMEWLGSANPATPTLPWSKPCCWCCQYQCRGDINCEKVGLFRVQTSDLTIFAAAFSKGDSKLSQVNICADLDHKKVGLFRVQTDDLAIFAQYFSKGDAKVPPCPMDWDSDGDTDYNFWVTDCHPGEIRPF